MPQREASPDEERMHCLSACRRQRHNTMPCFSWNRSPESVPAPIFTSFFPTDTRPAQFWRAAVAAKGCRREKAWKSHFMKPPCSRRPSHEVQAADFPFTTHRTQRRGAWSQPARVRACREPRGAGIPRDGSGEPLAASPTSGISLGGQSLLWSAKTA